MAEADWVREHPDEAVKVLSEVATRPLLVIPAGSYVTEGVMAVLNERLRQIDSEGWTPEHDDEHNGGELACAADAYIHAALANIAGVPPQPTVMWPWDGSWWKPSDDPIRNLVKAGALIAAEIDRLQRKG